MSSDLVSMMIQDSGLPTLIEHENPPGLTEISYRVGTYTSVLQRLKLYLTRHYAPGSGLFMLDLYANDSWSVALLEAWAMVIDILSFYQERIANEGYLATATEPRSVQELTAAIGYEPRPGVAASAYLAFTVRQPPDATPRSSIVPAGTVIQSLPTQIQPLGLPTDARPQVIPTPQVFETSVEFEARSAWNTLKSSSTTFKREHVIKNNLTTLRLLGTDNKLRPGDTLLIVAELPANATSAQQPEWIFATLNSIEINRTKGYTQVTWTDVMKSVDDDNVLHNPAIFVMRQKCGLYGYPTGSIYFSPLGTSDWSPSGIGLPPSTVYALVQHKAGYLLTATDNGVFRTANDGESWEPASSGLLSSKISSLTVSRENKLYAGSPSGNLFSSVDGSSNWKLLAVKPPRRTTLLGLSLPGQSLTSASLPKSVIRKISAFTTNKKNCLTVAMEEGVFLSSNEGTTWQQIHPGTPDADDKPDGGASSFVTTPTQTFVGMDTGAFSIDTGPPIPQWWIVAVAGIGGAIVLLGLLVLGNLLAFGGLLETFPAIAYAVSHFVSGYALLTFIVLLIALVALLALALWWRINFWQQKGLAQTIGAIQALVVAPDGALLAGTATGIYRSTDNGKTWQQVEQGPMLQIFSFAPNSDLQPEIAELDTGKLPNTLRQAFSTHDITLDLDAATAVIHTGQSWQVANKSEPALYLLSHHQNALDCYRLSSVQAFGVREPTYLFAGTRDGHVFRSQDNGAHWEIYITTSPFSDIRDLLVSASGIFAAGINAGTEAEGQWSRFHIQNRQIYLDKVYPSLASGGWAVLAQDQQVALHKVTAISSMVTKDFKKKNKVTCLNVDRADTLSSFDRRTATLFAQSEQLTMYNDDPVEGSTILLESLVPDLDQGHLLIVSGKRARVRLFDAQSQQPVLVSPDGLQQVPFNQDDTYVLMAQTPDPTASTSSWLLRTKDGFIGTLTTSAAAVVLYEPASDDDENIGEVVTINAVQQKVSTLNGQQQEQSLLLLQEPLLNAYDRATITIYGNVVYATHGQTVANEVLGNSNPAGSNDCFALKQKPLTYVPATTPDGAQSTLTVWVNQIRWHEVSSVQEFNTTRRTYLLRRDSQNNTIVYFSAGKQSTQLLTGTEQITASYRIGIGEAGNVPASTITLLRTRPAGIQKVTNPLAASGGTDPDSMQQMRQMAPMQIRALQRIISLNDYENFTRLFSGIGKVQARGIWNGRQQVVHITIAGTGGTSIFQDSQLHSNLLASIRAATTSLARPVFLASFELLYFQVKARLLLEPDYSDQQQAVLDSATQQISVSFDFDHRELAQNVMASEIIALLQHVTGVLAVELEDLYVRASNQPPAFNTVLVARSARYEEGRLLPAQMLLIDTQNTDGITLSMEMTQ